MLAGNYSRALAVLQEAVRVAESAFSGQPSEPLGLALRVLGNVCEKEARYEEALAAYRRALHVRSALLGEGAADVLAIRCNIAYVYGAQDALQAARDEYQATLALALCNFGEHHACAGVARNGLALMQWRLGECSQALENFQAALRIRERSYGASHPLCAATRNNMGLVLCRMGRYGESQAALREALDMRISCLGRRHVDVARTLQNLGGAHEAAMRAEVRRAASDGSSSSSGSGAAAMAESSDIVQALEAYSAAAACRRACFSGRDHGFVVESLVSVARVAAALGREQCAVEAGQEAWDMACRLQPQCGTAGRDAFLKEYKSSLQAKDFEEAREGAEAVAAVLELMWGGQHEAVLWAKECAVSAAAAAAAAAAASAAATQV